MPLYTVPEIFEKSQLWSAKKGLYLYSKEGESMAVAHELVKYSKSLPILDRDKINKKF